MGGIILHSIRFILFALFQILVLNNLELGWGAYPMLYPLFIMLLPFEMGTVPLMLISFAMGLTIDAFSNTFGLHASSALVFAYFRPLVFKLFSPRDGYENTEESNIYVMGTRWFFFAFGLLLLIHHTWFFAIEIFKWNEWLLLLRKIALSVPLSFLFSLIVQFIFISGKKSER
jgi:rod shape-determining protein MreD